VTAESLDLEAKMTALARTFPSMSSSPHVRLWDANSFDRWAGETPLSHGELMTARFLLAVWDPDHAWLCGRFDLMKALRVWDEKHREAFLAWASDPWWP
jgi:hypothetical protein